MPWDYLFKVAERYGLAVTAIAFLSGVIVWLVRFILTDKNAQIEALAEANKAKDEALLASHSREIATHDRVTDVVRQMTEVSSVLKLLVDRNGK